MRLRVLIRVGFTKCLVRLTATALDRFFRRIVSLADASQKISLGQKISSDLYLRSTSLIREIVVSTVDGR